MVIPYLDHLRKRAQTKTPISEQIRQRLIKGSGSSALRHPGSIVGPPDGWSLAQWPDLCYAGPVASVKNIHRRSYGSLCDLVAQLGGTVRLAREGLSWGLTVTISDDEERPPRAAGFFLNGIEEIDVHARLILKWIAGEQRSTTRRRGMG